MNGEMSAIGTKRTSLAAPHMSAVGGKADAVCVDNRSCSVASQPYRRARERAPQVHSLVLKFIGKGACVGPYPFQLPEKERSGFWIWRGSGGE